MVYTNYDDDFLVNSLPPGELERHESAAIAEIGAWYVDNDLYKEWMVKCRTYMHVARVQYEADGMEEKYKVYEKEFNRWVMLSKNQESAVSDELGSVRMERA